ncbi:MAG: 4Fe-4S dicluster domain-containing protein [Proteobacteria bacterium]|nr:4Fe-4S dicluster domain-containing protein [Pseudomonadota bacterium]
MENQDLYHRLGGKLSFYSLDQSAIQKLEDILRIVFLPEEAELALDLSFAVTDVKEIAGSLGKKVEELIPRLEKMADKGLVYAVKKGNQRRYQLLPLVPGVVELQFMGDKPPVSGPDQVKLAKLFEEFYQQMGMDQFLFRARTPYTRVIAVESQVTPQSAVQPYEMVSHYIRETKDLAIGNCYCRTEKKILGKACSAPVDVCMVFGPFARFTIERGFAKAADQSRMLKALDRAEEAGLVHVVDNIQDKINFICNCCGCCCGFLQGITRFKIPNAVAFSRFQAVLDKKACTGCGVCVDRCQVKAIQESGDKVKIDLKGCLGCGACVSTCPAEAISLKERKDFHPPVSNLTELRMTILREQSEAAK